MTISVTKLLENSGVLIYGVDESVKHETIKKNKEADFLVCYRELLKHQCSKIY